MNPLDVGVLPWRTRCGAHVLDTHPLRRRGHRLKCQIAVVNQVARRLIPRECLAKLLRGLRRGRMRRHGDMHDATAVVREDDQHEQQPTRRGWHDEEIGCGDLPGVIRQERPPGLRGR
jgi:hypothetical protein